MAKEAKKPRPQPQRQSLGDRRSAIHEEPRVLGPRPRAPRHHARPLRPSLRGNPGRRPRRRAGLPPPPARVHRRAHGPPPHHAQRHGGTEVPLHAPQRRREGPFTLKDQLSCYPSYGGRNFLNLSTFRDDSDVESVELSSWVRWYAGVLEQSLTVSRVLGYYLNSCESQERRKSLVSGASNADLLCKLETLVGFVEEISHVPDSLHLQRSELVYEVVRLVGESYRSVQGEIVLRLEELGDRMEGIDVGELNELVGCLGRLEGSHEKLVLLFVNRRKNNGFWDLVKYDEGEGRGEEGGD
ncbi:putative clathrin assembly protein [Spatholobus suberectus]|nr:putative clathrin assembly protein [Spatholobus suberectus]